MMQGRVGSTSLKPAGILGCRIQEVSMRLPRGFYRAADLASPRFMLCHAMYAVSLCVRATDAGRHAGAFGARSLQPISDTHNMTLMLMLFVAPTSFEHTTSRGQPRTFTFELRPLTSHCVLTFSAAWEVGRGGRAEGAN